MSELNPVPPGEPAQVGRLAIRSEGAHINAYYARMETMRGAVLLFSVNQKAARLPSVREKIFELGQAIVGEIIHEQTGQRPTWEAPVRGPEHVQTNED